MSASMINEIPVYPILTQEVGRNGTSSGSTSSSTTAPGNNLAHLAKNAIRASLGWQYRGGDATANLKTFQAALGKAFRFKEVEGHTEWDWVPQGFSVQADLGEITGAQASIYRQAQSILDQTLPVLERLEPLREAADEDDIESMRMLIRSELTDLVSELGRPAGPRVQKVDHYFCLLLAAHPISKGQPNLTVYNPLGKNYGGQLRRFRDRLGMDEDRVNTVDEEVQLTDFLLLGDNVSSLHHTWLQKRPAFTGEDRPFFGTLLTQLSQQMEVIVGSVHEVYSALDSVYVGAAERQVIDLGSREVFVDDIKSKRPLTAADLPAIKRAATPPPPPPPPGKAKQKKALAAAGPLFAYVTALSNKRADRIVTRIATAADARSLGGTLNAITDLLQLLPAHKTKLLAALGIDVIAVGPGANALSLDGLLNWIESYVTAEGRLQLEQGGKDGAVAFGSTICKFAEYVSFIAAYSAQYSIELYAEIGGFLNQKPAQLSSGMGLHPGIHTGRAYRAFRELYTHLAATCKLTGSKNLRYGAMLVLEKPESDEHDCGDCSDRHLAGNAPQSPSYAGKINLFN